MAAFREYILNYLSIVFISAICQIVLPGGGMKKYVKYFCSLLLIVILIQPFTKDINLNFDFSSYNLDTQAYEVEARERVLALHRQNLEKKLSEYFGKSVHVILNEDGSVSKIHVIEDLSEDEIKYLENEYGVKRENILKIPGD
ncbi:MAG: stage III sporulation protein AF [Clostridiaceae bacterium]|nr:stage III sporulation protein AF [Clostridiaceae bacterium]